MAKSELEQREDDVIRRMLKTPPMPHSAMKVGKRKKKKAKKTKARRKRA